MLQLEGSKRWRLHVPPAGEEFPLPREYSRDFQKSELGELLIDCVLETGDLLYLPRGTVHYGVAEASSSSSSTPGSGFSHHLTVSTYQRTAWCNFLEKALAGALGRAAGESSEFREGLPVNCLNYMGSWHELGSGDVDDSKKGNPRAAFVRRVRGLISRLQEFIDVDEVCDELGLEFMSGRLPPSAKATASTTGKSTPGINADSKLRWVDISAVRPMLSTDPETSEASVMLFHSFTNDSRHHMCKDTEAEEDVGCLRYEAATFLPAIRMLCAAGTSVIRCGDLPLVDESDKIALCEDLFTAGLLELVP